MENAKQKPDAGSYAVRPTAHGLFPEIPIAMEADMYNPINLLI